ncbi:sugar phosphate isomerase/epimerase [Tetragenococcus koreensis]|uniref:Sugar phosphate isomerase n=1 Tax=Tetragenococcus koreensis TaxID=290335 RepID=A0AAN4UC78_9ENTE|nr:sugar phosphate isomerase/epimerase [Tetragenococcus koreensis]MDN6850826.1 sugar phosphate isomerase/epimerase [Staphylococcus equorum]AYW46340.1 AP endonuclease [Tetragenococcus koreensis]MCF1585406.1 sugar phosphate isomerase/epimerase [Tetragenococcus koreensis]MCF1614952.1 sugar phosphate isomerase/epimerase [Tetragenococcus koreensis]MCF1616978.1 sugar phosphate isomerase/epimerase [Tetragenococcus koreensis]
MSKRSPITVSSWTLGDQCKFEDRVKTAKEAGYEGIGLRAETYVDALNEGLFDQDILEILAKYEMKVTEVEYIVQWAEEHRSYEQKYKEQVCFHMCNLFGVSHVNIGLMESYSVEYTAQKLKELCQRAGNYIIGVEPMPYSGLPDFDRAYQVVKQSGCDNAMVILDVWHWVRADQPYRSLTKEEAAKVISIQISDAYERPYADAILRDESMHDRLAPGVGAKDTAGFVRMVKESGINPKVIGVEVISDAYLVKGLEFTNTFTFDKTIEILKEVWPEQLPEELKK